MIMFKTNALARFTFPVVVITNNGSKIGDKAFKKFLDELRVTKYFTSSEHPQTNWITEISNMIPPLGTWKN